MKLAKMILAVLLTFVMIAVCLPAAFAESGDLAWNYDPATKTLTFSGTGPIPDNPNPDKRGWRYMDCEKVVIQDGINRIGDYAFAYFKALQSVTIADSVTTIGSNAFNGCVELTSADLGANVTSIGNYAFNDCYYLVTVKMGNKVTSIGNSGFCDCQHLETITIPGGLQSIGKNAFEDCYHLKSITIPIGVTSIGERTFFKNTSLRTVSIPSGVTSIGKQAFFGCTGLEEVAIPKSVETIEDYAFVNCKDLSTVNYGSSEKDWNKISKGSCVFGWYDGTYTDRTAGEMPTFHFLADPVEVALSATVLKKTVTGSGGTVTGSGAYEKGALITITATRDEGFVFDGWYGVHAVTGELTTKKYSSATQTLTVNEDLVLAALFVKASTPVDPKISIQEFTTSSMTIGFRSAVTFHAAVEDPVSGGEIHWFFNGTDEHTGSTFIIAEAAKTFTVQAKYMKDGKALAESPIGSVIVAMPVIAIHNYRESRSLDYRATISFSVDPIQSPVSGAQVQWYVDGQYKSSGDAYTVKEATSSFTVQAKYVDDSEILAESAVEKVSVNTGFFAKLIAFFRGLFGLLPKVTQEFLGARSADL